MIEIYRKCFRELAPAIVVLLFGLAGLGAAPSADARSEASGSKVFFDKIHGETVMWVTAEYYIDMIDGRWNSELCIAPSHNVNDTNCTQLEFIDFFEDDQENIFVKLGFSMGLGEGLFGYYPYRGFNIGMWFGQPCNGGYIKGFVYPNPPHNIDHEENITSLPDGNSFVC